MKVQMTQVDSLLYRNSKNQLNPPSSGTKLIVQIKPKCEICTADYLKIAICSSLVFFALIKGQN